MLNKQLKEKSFFIALAHLFYAVAFVDKKIRLSEKHKIIEEIDAYWLCDLDNTTSSELMYEILKQNRTNVLTVENAFNNFQEYFNLKKEFFTVETKTMILDSAEAIAHAYASKNKSELVLLSRIQLLLAKS